MRRRIAQALSTASSLTCIATCLLWYRSSSSVDEVAVTYDRYIADGRAASNAIYATSESRLWLTILSGSVAPYDGKLVWGYHINAEQSGGKPRFQRSHSPYATSVFSGDGRIATDASAMSGWGPIRWLDFSRDGNTERFRSVKIGVTYWFVVIVTSLLPIRQIGMRYRLRMAPMKTKLTDNPGNPASLQNQSPSIGTHLISTFVTPS